MFPRNRQPENLRDLVEKFRDAPRIHDFIRSQLEAGARFALTYIRVVHPKLELEKLVETCHDKCKTRRKNVMKINEAVSPISEALIEDLLRMDSEFFVKGNYVDHIGTDPERFRIDDLL